MLARIVSKVQIILAVVRILSITKFNGLLTVFSGTRHTSSGSRERIAMVS